MLDRFTKQEFTSNGSWTAPAGVTRILIYGMGGGAGGNGGTQGTAGAGGAGGQGGAGVSLLPYVVTVVPNTTYSITIGTGGAGAPGGGNSFRIASAGGNTIFGNSIIEWKGASVHPNLGSTPDAPHSSSFWNVTFSPTTAASNAYTIYPSGGYGNAANQSTIVRGYPGRLGVSANMTASAGATIGGGGGSGQTGEDIGGVGGIGVANAIGGAGGNAPANSGAGGGGGAGGGATSKVGGAGGNGGSGKIIIMWVE